MSRADDVLAQQKENLGKQIGVSRWFDITQEDVTQFAKTTQDEQFIHVDPQLAKTHSPFGGTIAHGFYVLSLAVAMAEESIEVPQGRKMGVNYGFEKIRFINPVPVGSRVRGLFVLESVEQKQPGAILSKMGLSVEIEGQEKPALVATWLGMAFY